jgi:hypothetical protein
MHFNSPIFCVWSNHWGWRSVLYECGGPWSQRRCQDNLRAERLVPQKSIDCLLALTRYASFQDDKRVPQAVVK